MLANAGHRVDQKDYMHASMSATLILGVTPRKALRATIQAFSRSKHQKDNSGRKGAPRKIGQIRLTSVSDDSLRELHSRVQSRYCQKNKWQARFGKSEARQSRNNKKCKYVVQFVIDATQGDLILGHNRQDYNPHNEAREKHPRPPYDVDLSNPHLCITRLWSRNYK